MKQIINGFTKGFVAIALTSVSSSISSGFIAVSAAQALEEGLYWGGGSRYIQIAKKASPTGDADRDRYCYQGFSSNGTMIVSLNLVIPRIETGIDYEVYSLQGDAKNDQDGLSIQQNYANQDKIRFGKLAGRFVSDGSFYERDRKDTSERSLDLQECLNSDQPYFKKISSGRDRR